MVNYVPQAAELADAKREHDWLRAAPSHILQQTLRGLDKSQAVFVCTACGHRDHADVNGAKNILSAAGHVVSACGDLAVGRSVKQEPAAP